MNILCDERAKELIQSEEREFVEWPITLSSPYTIMKNLSQVLSERAQIKFYIKKVKSSSCLTDKLKISIKFEKIDWESRSKHFYQYHYLCRFSVARIY